MIVFLLGREPALARAELLAVFPGLKEVSCDGRRLFADGVSADEARSAFPRIGGTIKALLRVTDAKDVRSWISAAVDYLAAKSKAGSKTTFGVSGDAPRFDRFRAGRDIKLALKAKGISARFVNKDNADVPTPVVLREKLDDAATELHALALPDGVGLAATVAVQDIDAYSARDMNRQRDLKVGMLPPKLAQALVNLAVGTDLGKGVWDPFVGLGGVLAEAVRSGARRVVGGDVSARVLNLAKQNVEAAVKELGSKVRMDFYEADARMLSRQLVFGYRECAVVTEGFLGSPFAGGRVPSALAAKEKEFVAPIYSEFLASLRAGGFKGRAVVCAPLWHLASGEDLRIGAPAMAHAMGVKIVPNPEGGDSLTYRRPDQAVGREIFVLDF